MTLLSSGPLPYLKYKPLLLRTTHRNCPPVLLHSDSNQFFSFYLVQTATLIRTPDETLSDMTRTEMFTHKVTHQIFIHVTFSCIHWFPFLLSDISPDVPLKLNATFPLLKLQISQGLNIFGNINASFPQTHVYKGESTGSPFIPMGISVISDVPVKLLSAERSKEASDNVTVITVLCLQLQSLS